MGKMILTNVRLFAAGADLTAASNKVELSGEVEDKDATTFASNGWKEVLGGLASTKLSAEGLWEAGPGLVDDTAWAGIGGAGPWTACPVDAAVGSLAWQVQAVDTSYALGGAVGDIAPYTAAAASTWPLVRGQIAHPPGVARTATGTGTGAQLGAVGAGQQLYISLHVLSVAGTTPALTVAIESDDNSGFTSPTTVATAATASAAGGQILRVPGPITDTWFRPKWTITGTTPSFLFVVAYGIK